MGVTRRTSELTGGVNQHGKPGANHQIRSLRRATSCFPFFLLSSTHLLFIFSFRSATAFLATRSYFAIHLVRNK